MVCKNVAFLDELDSVVGNSLTLLARALSVLLQPADHQLNLFVAFFAHLLLQFTLLSKDRKQVGALQSDLVLATVSTVQKQHTAVRNNRYSLPFVNTRRPVFSCNSLPMPFSQRSVFLSNVAVQPKTMYNVRVVVKVTT